MSATYVKDFYILEGGTLKRILSNYVRLWSRASNWVAHSALINQSLNVFKYYLNEKKKN